MNKRQAKQYAYRLVRGLLEDHVTAGSRPPYLLRVDGNFLVYDELTDKAVEGRRLSPEDSDRVTAALEQLAELLGKQDGWKDIQRVRDQNAAARDPRTRPRFSPVVDKPLPYAKADGKPGPKWKGYKEWLRKQGRTV